jgi:hypothetical protein
MASSYSYDASYSSGGAAGGTADSVFNQVDANRDGRVDLGEFRNFVGQNIGAGGAGYGTAGSAGYGTAGSSSYEASSYETSSAGLTGVAGGYDASFSAGGGLAGASTYDASSYSATGYGADLGAVSTEAVGVGGTAYESAASTTQVQQYATDAQGLFIDSNPQIIRRPALGGVQTYTQNIRIRFLQPPPVPPPGPLIIKEVRPPQPPPPPPLRIRQQAPPLPQPPPLILRERPPVPPASVASQTVIRRLAALPVPPRSVIIERLPPLPPRPRDIIIERWVPYGAQAKRRTIVQRAAAAAQYARPRNVIIQYEPVQVRIVRQFVRLGVTPADPVTYVQQYGATLLDAATLVQQARAAGVIEDISPPHVGGAVGFSAGTYGVSSGFETGAAGLTGTTGLAGAGLEAGLGGGYSSSSYESSSYSSGGVGGAEFGLAGTEASLGGVVEQAGLSGAAGGVSSSSYSSEVAY